MQSQREAEIFIQNVDCSIYVKRTFTRDISCAQVSPNLNSTAFLHEPSYSCFDTETQIPNLIMSYFDISLYIYIFSQLPEKVRYERREFTYSNECHLSTISHTLRKG